MAGIILYIQSILSWWIPLWCLAAPHASEAYHIVRVCRGCHESGCGASRSATACAAACACRHWLSTVSLSDNQRGLSSSKSSESSNCQIGFKHSLYAACDLFISQALLNVQECLGHLFFVSSICITLWDASWTCQVLKAVTSISCACCVVVC